MTTNTSDRRVVITGMGVVSPVGSTVETMWESLTSGKSGVGQLESFPADALPTPFAAEARDFTGHISEFGPLEKEQKKSLRKRLNVMCREIHMGIAAAQHALNAAGLLPKNFDPERIGVIYGSDYMMTLPEEFVDGVKSCLNEDHEFEFERWGEEGLPKVAPLWLLKYLPNMPAAYIAIYNDLQGPNNSITVREASSNLAVGEACNIISRGDADILVAGATGTRVHPMRSVHTILQEELAHSGDDPTKLSRPFDKDRTGMVLGEGAGAVVVETLESAQHRGAPIVAEVVGFASSTVVDRQFVAQRKQALLNAMQMALAQAGLSTGDVGHIHAHGLSTRQCDIDEAQAIREVFGQNADRVPVVAAKSNFGNLGAGSGLVELVASLSAQQHGHLFPALNYDQPDPECPIHLTTSGDTPAGECFLNLSVTPQAQASAVLVRKFAQ